MRIRGFARCSGAQIHLITFKRYDYEEITMNYVGSDIVNKDKQSKTDFLKIVPRWNNPKFFKAKTEEFRKIVNKGTVILVKKLGLGIVLGIEPGTDYVHVKFVKKGKRILVLYLFPQMYMRGNLKIIREVKKGSI